MTICIDTFIKSTRLVEKQPTRGAIADHFLLSQE